MLNAASRIARGQSEVFRQLWVEFHPLATSDRALPAKLEQRLRQDRRFGSRDRRLYRELVYTALRYRSWLPDPGQAMEDAAIAAVVWLSADLPATRELKRSLLSDWPPAGSSIDERSAFLLGKGLAHADRPVLPDWFRAECPVAFTPPLNEVLVQRAPLWIRLQTGQPERVEAEFRAQGWGFTPSPDLPGAWRMEGAVDLTRSDAFADGRIEVQDLGSQWIVAQLPLAAGERWLDACAGAGGKTLHLASRLGGTVRVFAHDIRAAALDELRLRARRAGLQSIEVTRAPETLAGDGFDGVLVDAPCTGTGTWRRAPHLKWSTQPADVAAAAVRQGALLDRYRLLVRPGGLLVYATCSLAASENEAVVRRFLERHPDFRPESAPLRVLPRARPASPGHTLLPSLYDTDGFYCALLRRA